MLKKNILASLLSNFWSFASVFLFVPIYINILGVEAYGLVGFHVILISVFSILDLGITVTLKREMSRLSSLNNFKELQDTLRTFELLYLILALLVIIFLWFLAPIIAEYWLSSSFFDIQEMTAAVRLMGISVGLQLPTGLFVGAIMGLQRQILANLLIIFGGILRIAGSLFLLKFFSASIENYFIGYILANGFFLLLIRFKLWKIIKNVDIREDPKFKLNIIKQTGKFALSMASMSLIGIFLNQTDKIIVGKLASLEMFSFYTMAVTFASIPIIITGALSSAIFPMFTEIVASSNIKSLKRIYSESCELVGIIIVPIFLVLFFFTKEILFIWTGSTKISSTIETTASILLIGQFLQSITTIPYTFALANGNVRMSQRIGVASILFVIPLLIYLTLNLGIIGASISWLILNIAVFPFNIYYLHIQKVSFVRMWFVCLKSCIYPFLPTIPVLLFFLYFMKLNKSRFDLFAQIFVVWFILFFLAFLFSNRSIIFVRAQFIRFIKNTIRCCIENCKFIW
jgi:O-antigen/teichoic acid export membrane protein